MQCVKVVDYLKKHLLDGLNGLDSFLCCNHDENDTCECLKQALNVFQTPLEHVLKISAKLQYEGIALHGTYWIVASLILLKNNREHSHDITQFILAVKTRLKCMIKSCWVQEVGGYRPSPSFSEPDTILATMYAVQTLQLLDLHHTIDTQAVRRYIFSLQQKETAAFKFSHQATWISQEVDLRAVLCALVSLAHLDQSNDLVSSFHTLPNFPYPLSCMIRWILNCQNADGGFGCSPGNESHAGYTYCAIASLAFLNQLHGLLADPVKFSSLCWFLECRQIFFRNSCDALVCNGRPGKPPDVCYSWWVLATLEIIHRAIDSTPELNIALPPLFHVWEHRKNHHRQGILQFLQEDGGFSRSLFESSSESFMAWFSLSSWTKEGSHSSPKTDPYHTFFALATLALFPSPCTSYLPLAAIDPMKAFPV